MAITGSKPLLTVSTANRLVLTLQRLYTFTTIRIKVLKNFEPNHTYVLIRHNTTLLRCDCIGTLRGLYKDSLTCDNPLRFQVKVVITLPNEVVPCQRTIKHYQLPQEDRAIPYRCIPSCLFGKIVTS